MPKPVYLVLLGISIVVAAVSLGVVLTRYLGLRAYSPKGAAQAAAIPSGPNAPVTPAEEWNNLFAPGDGMKMASRLPAANASSASQAPRTMFVLVGTIVSSSPAARRAILWANGMKEPKAYREKEEIEPGALLSSVERDKVWISRGKEREKLDLLPVGSHARPTGTGAPAVVPSGAAAAQPPASPDRVPPLPGFAPAPPPARTQAAVPAEASSGEDEDAPRAPRVLRGPSQRKRR